MRTRLLAILGTSLFLAFAGVGVASALWSTPAAVTSNVRAADLNDSCLNPTSVVNASFEQPVADFTYQNRTDVVGWKSRNNATGADMAIEVWKGTTEGIAPPVGNQFVELNSTAAGTLYQTIATTPGQTLQWSLLHRGRQGADTMQLNIGVPGTPGVSQGQFTTDRSAWVRYSGAYVVPAGQTQTELNFMAVSTSSGNQSIGNLLDDVSFGTGPCLTATSAAAKVPASGGSYNVGDLVQYTTTVNNIGSSLASNSTYTFAVPAGVEFVANSVRIDGVAKSDSAGDDQVDYASASRTITARLGMGATSSVGGSIAQGTSSVITYQARIVAAAADSTVAYQPTITYVNDLAPNWPRTTQPANLAIQVAPSADLAVTMTSNPTTVNRGTTTTAEWRIRVTNNGPNVATGSSIAVAIPTALSGGAPTGGNLTCTAPNSSGIATCTPTGAFNAGSVRDIVVQRSIPTSAAVGTVYTVTATASSTSNDHVGDNNSASATVTINDTQAPTVPGTPTASGTTATQTTLSWTASSDNVGVTGYRVYRNGTLVASPSGTSATITGLSANTAYSFTVSAVDAAGNESARSTARSVTTPMAFNAANFY
ncbi:MAG: fibronectin type III domain-containing protein, partial [Ilumatobacteraceae bacterium]